MHQLKHIIHKEFGFCYGHRVWSQTLDVEYSLDSCLKCRHLHGHEGLVTVRLGTSFLRNGMVVDFKYLNWFKKWLDDTLDHKFIMDLNDPLLKYEVPIIFDSLGNVESLALIKNDLANCYTINPNYFKMETEPALVEKYEGMIFVDFVPTSEYLSKFLFDVIVQKMKPLDMIVHSVSINETPKSQATYYG